MMKNKNAFAVVETSVETSVKTPTKTPIETPIETLTKDGELKLVGPARAVIGR
jgi:hypothetical protein